MPERITEKESLYQSLEKMEVMEILRGINKEDEKVSLAIGRILHQIETVVILITQKMKDGGRRRFGRDLGESLQLAADPSGRCFSLDADGNATYNGPLLDQVIRRSSLGKSLEQRRRGSFNNVQSTNCRVFKER